MLRVFSGVCAFALAMGVSGGVSAGEVKVFKDWAVGCDNLGDCKAVALGPDWDGGGALSYDGAVAIVITRAGAADSAPVVEISASPGGELDLTAARVWRAAVEGRAAPFAVDVDMGDGTARLTGAKAADLIAAMKAGDRLALVSSALAGRASLRGLSAALLYMDDAQGRVGTVAAFVKPGDKPAEAAPRKPAAAVRSPRGSDAPPAALDAAAIAALVDAKTHCDGADPEFIHSSPTFARLDAATTLLTVDLNCGGAYNVATGVFLLDNGGASRPAVFDSPTDYAEFGANWISSGYWDDAERELSSYHRGRGLGDCGDSASYAWDGDQFRLTEQAEMPVCRGSMETIRTFRRPVERL